MKRVLVVLLAALSLVLTAREGRAQAVETPIPFDSAGRVMVLTPLMAARLELGPPAWRVTGDFTEARLYQLGDQSFVLTVRRRDGSVERYSLTAGDRDYLRARTSTLPVNITGELTQRVEQGIESARAQVTRATRNSKFVRDQTILGLAVYAPSFARTLTSDVPGQVAAYILAAGGTFFAASQYADDYVITEPQRKLSTSLAIAGGAMGYGIGYGAKASASGTALGVFVGSLAGTGAGLYFGQTMSDVNVAAANFGALSTAAVAGAAMAAITPRDSLGHRKSWPTRGEALGLVGAGIVGYSLGGLYPSTAHYNVTGGDIYSLLVTGGIGTLGAAAISEGVGANSRSEEIALAGGYVVGVLAGDRLLVRRFDHSDDQAGILALSAVGGGLMGAGIYALVDRNRTNDAAPLALATAGAIAGVTVAEYVMSPASDGKRTASRLSVDPTALLLAASKVPGEHAIVRVRF